MNNRKFKPGDQVQHCNGGPVMKVLQYILEYNPWIGNFVSDDQTECVWYENGQWKSRVFRQDVLINCFVPADSVAEDKSTSRISLQ